MSRKRLEILETQLTTRISQLEGMMYNTIIKQTEQFSRELDEKNDILCKFMDSNIFKNFANSFLQNDIVSELSRQPPEYCLSEYRHQEYISSNCNAVIDDINKDTQIDNYDTDKKSNSHEVVDSTSPKAKTKAWPRETCLVTGDSMLSYIDETRMSKKFNVKVRSFPGAKTDDMFYYLVPSLEKNPDYVILHFGTNDAVDHQSNDIISKIFKLKEFIQCSR